MELYTHIKLRTILSSWKYSGVDCVERFHRKDLFTVHKSNVRTKYLPRLWNVSGNAQMLFRLAFETWGIKNMCRTKKEVNLEYIAVDTNCMLLWEFWYARILMLLWSMPDVSNAPRDFIVIVRKPTTITSLKKCVSYAILVQRIINLKRIHTRILQIITVLRPYGDMYIWIPFSWIQRTLRFADNSLARPGRKQATFPAFYRTWRFITTPTRVHHLSLP